MQHQTTAPISRYVADNSFNPAAAIKVIAVSGLIGMAFGFIASFLGINGIYITGLVPIVVGLCMGVLLAFAQTFTMNRNMVATAIAAVVASIVCVGFLNWFEYRQFVNNIESAYPEERQIAFLKEEYKGREDELSEHVRNEIANRAASAEVLEYLRIDSLNEYMAYKVKSGGQVSLQKGEANPNRKSKTTVLTTWAVEWFLMTGLIAFAATRLRQPPFCSDCNQWLESSSAGQIPGDATLVAERIEMGDFASIKHIEAGEAITSLSLHRCKRCSSPDNAVLEIKQAAGSEQTITKLVVPDHKLAELSAFIPETEEESKVLNAVNELGSSVRKEVTSGTDSETNPDSAVEEYMAKLMNRDEQ